MSSVAQYDVSNSKDSDEFQRFSSQVISDLQALVNGNLTFQNMKINLVSAAFPTANADVFVDHTLNKQNVNFIVATPSVAGSIYLGSGTSNKRLALRSSVAGMSALIVIF